MKHTSFLVTGFSNNDKCVSLLNLLKGSRSASSLRLFAASASTCRFGIEFAKVGWMVETRLRARSSVLRRSESGKLPSCWMSLSVKSIASCGCGKPSQLSINSTTLFPLGIRKGLFFIVGLLTPATPKFSMAGILWPDVTFSEGRVCSIQLIDQKCSICPLGKRTS